MISLDTICALATPAGGAIGVIRLSGPDALEITDKVFSWGCPTRSHLRIKDARPNSIHYGTMHDMQGNDIDDVIVLVYRAPHSYTGEDATEICCHGSRYILQQALHTLITAGARQAAPGEYTRRAFLNRATHQMALSQLKGHFSSELSKLRSQLLKMTSLLELELDFSDHEELEFADRGELKELATKIDNRITTLTRSFDTGNALRQGIPVAIIGKTNVGKSTLLNRLLHEEKAIVSSIDGTTRDVIEDVTNINGITFRFIDTAGIRETQDTIEKLGIERTFRKLDEATIVLWILDACPTKQEISDIITRCQDKILIPVINKIDLKTDQNSVEEAKVKSGAQVITPRFTLPDSVASLKPLYISAKLGLGIDELEKRIYQAADIPEINENSVIITSARHYEALLRAHESISRVISGLASDISGDLLAEDLRLVLSELADITGGQITSQETLNNIFSHFCVGK